MDPDRFEVSVTDGRVVLAGKVEWRSQIGPLLHAIRYVEGVVSATIRLDYRKPLVGHVQDLRLYDAGRPMASLKL